MTTIPISPIATNNSIQRTMLRADTERKTAQVSVNVESMILCEKPISA